MTANTAACAVDTATAGVAASGVAGAVGAIGAAATSVASSDTADAANVVGAAASGAARSSESLLRIDHMTCGYGKGPKYRQIVHDVSFTVNPGDFLCIIGANGCGKTTSLKALMGLLPLEGGKITVCGNDLSRMAERQRARHFAYIPQAHTPPFPFKVADVVLLGRTPYINRLAHITEKDRLIALYAMRLLGIEHLAEKAYTTLSGGQQQLVLIARALTQQSDVLVMDEPTAALDFGNQQLVLSRMRTLSDMGKAVVMVTHDPDHALFCANKVVVMDQGTVLREGTPAECITSEILAHIYGTQACVVDVDVEDGKRERVCIPLR